MPQGSCAAVAERQLSFFPPLEAALRTLAPLSLLESAGPAGLRSRWSVIGLDPAGRFLSRGGVNEMEDYRRDERRRWREEPLAALRRAMAAYPRVEPRAGRPFAGGAIGWFSYELGRRLLPLPSLALDDLRIPEISLYIHDRWLLLDHEREQCYAMAWARGDSPRRAAREAQRQAEALHGSVEARLSGAASASARTAWEDPLARGDAAGGRRGFESTVAAGAAPLPVQVDISPQDYRDRVQRCREEIRAGNAYELCLTNRFEAVAAGDPWDLYLELRRANPAPFACALLHPELSLVGASPERFLKVDPTGRVEARPIKGTRPRGEDRRQDAALLRSLARSEKDRAENVMIVDLLRNDLSRVCVPGSVAVPELCALESYASVHQMVSTITGRLREDRDRYDLLAASFPGGSMTGAPKIAAMALLEALEPRVRGVYSGAAGYLGFDGAMDLAIVIRSVQLLGERALVGAGGAVVFESDPQREWEEALHKADASLRAIARWQGCSGYELAQAASLTR